MSLEPEERKKRAAKRYSYACNAECVVDGVSRELKIINISAAGVQFATSQKIESKNEILIKWTDPRFGTFHPTFAIAREIHNPNSSDFPFFYGAQYFNLKDEARDNLLKLLKHFKEQAEQENKEQVEKITPGYLFSVLDQGAFFLKTAMASNTLPSYFDELIKKMPEYERTSFSLSDDYAKMIQKLATFHVHCDVLRSLADSIKNQPELHGRYFRKVEETLQKVGGCAEEAPVESSKIKASQASEELKKKLIDQLSESGNRLYYSAQEMLDVVIKDFDSIAQESSELKIIYSQIKQAHIQKKSQQSEPQPSKYEPKKTSHLIMEDFSEIEKVLDAREERPKRVKRAAPPPPEVSRSNSPRLLLLVLLVGASYFAYEKFDQMKKLDSFVKEMNLGVPLQSFSRVGSQLNLFFVSTAWAVLPDDQKMEVYQKIQARLAIDPTLVNAILFDDRQKTLQFINESMQIR